MLCPEQKSVELMADLDRKLSKHRGLVLVAFVGMQIA